MDCQLGCQSDRHADCKAELQGGCEAQCDEVEGALVCDGQFIDVSDIDSCVSALRDRMNIEVQFEG